MITRKPCGCVCLGDCEVAQDDFNRADSESPGTGWTEEAGDGDIVDEQLAIDTADSALIHDGEYPGVGSLGFYKHPGAAEALAYSETEGAEGKIYGAWLDEDNHHYARWTFEADQARLRFGRVNGGFLSQSVEDYIIPGRGVGVATRLHFCWQQGALTITSPDFNGPLSSVSSAWNLHIGGNRAGVGTGATAGVTFDDYLGTKTAPSACGRCPRCSHCSDTQQLCVTATGFTNIPDTLYQFADWHNGERVLDRTIFCNWSQERGSGQASDTVSLFFDGTDWILQAAFVVNVPNPPFGNKTATATFRKNLGPALPDCSALNCLRLDYVSCGINPPLPGGETDCSEWTQDAIVAVASGDCFYYDCYYYYDGDDLPPGIEGCCVAERDPLPGTLYATLYNPYTGALIAEDVELTHDGAPVNPSGTHWRYAGTIDSHPEGCDTAVQFTCEKLPDDEGWLTRLDYTAKNTFGTCVLSTIYMRIISCDPFHAVPDPEVLEGDWEGVEVIE